MAAAGIPSPALVTEHVDAHKGGGALAGGLQPSQPSALSTPTPRGFAFGWLGWGLEPQQPCGLASPEQRITAAPLATPRSFTEEREEEETNNTYNPFTVAELFSQMRCPRLGPSTCEQGLGCDRDGLKSCQATVSACVPLRRGNCRHAQSKDRTNTQGPWLNDETAWNGAAGSCRAPSSLALLPA